MTSAVVSPAGRSLEVVGREGAPVVVVLGGISSSSHVTASPQNPVPGWWSSFVGPGRTIDTTSFRVASIDYHVSDDPGPLSVSDQAAALSRALDLEGFDTVHAIVGASYGGTVALAVAALEPERTARLIVYGACHESAPFATACRTLQRQIVELGIQVNRGREALEIARGLAITAYSTRDEFVRRFGAPDPAARYRDIEEYLGAEGERFASRFLPDRFLEISRSQDLDHIDARSIRARTTLIGVVEDALVPPSLLRSLAELIGPACTLEIVSSSFGHDAFIDDPACISQIVARALEAAPEAVS